MRPAFVSAPSACSAPYVYVFLSSPYGVFYFMCSVHRLLLSASYCTILSILRV